MTWKTPSYELFGAINSNELSNLFHRDHQLRNPWLSRWVINPATPKRSPQPSTHRQKNLMSLPDHCPNCQSYWIWYSRKNGSRGEIGSTLSCYDCQHDVHFDEDDEVVQIIPDPYRFDENRSPSAQDENLAEFLKIIADIKKDIEDIKQELRNV